MPEISQPVDLELLHTRCTWTCVIRAEKRKASLASWKRTNHESGYHQYQAHTMITDLRPPNTAYDSGKGLIISFAPTRHSLPDTRH